MIQLSAAERGIFLSVIEGLEIDPDVLKQNHVVGVEFAREHPNEVKFLLAGLVGDEERRESWRTCHPEQFVKLCQWAAQHLAECLVEAQG